MDFKNGYLYSISLAFGGGIVLSAFGTSILTLTGLAVLAEMIHAYLIKFNYTYNEIALRLILYLASITGFILGRELILHDINYEFFR